MFEIEPRGHPMHARGLFTHRLFAYAATLAASIAFAACSPSTTVEQEWTTPSIRSEPALTRVMTVFFSDNVTLRRSGEDQLARDLRARGVQATPAYLVLDDAELADLDKVKSKLRQLGYDGVVMMRIIDAHQEVGYFPPTFDGYWGYSYPFFYSPGFYASEYWYTENVVRIETSAYSLDTNRLVWSAVTRTIDEDADDLVDETSEVVARELTGRGLARDEG